MIVHAFGLDGITPVVTYDFGQCFPIAYQTQPISTSTKSGTGLDFLETLQIHCPQMTAFVSHQSRPGMAQWFQDLFQGSLIQDSLEVIFFDKNEQEIRRHQYLDAFPIRYRFPSFDTSGQIILHEELTIKANDLIID